MVSSLFKCVINRHIYPCFVIELLGWMLVIDMSCFVIEYCYFRGLFLRFFERDCTFAQILKLWSILVKVHNYLIYSDLEIMWCFVNWIYDTFFVKMAIFSVKNTYLSTQKVLSFQWKSTIISLKKYYRFI